MVGILDIAKCLYEAISKLEHAYEVSSKRLEATVKKFQRRMSGVSDNLFETLREKVPSKIVYPEFHSTLMRVRIATVVFADAISDHCGGY